jgi:hypothetical protein
LPLETSPETPIDRSARDLLTKEKQSTPNEKLGPAKWPNAG